jgi:hypothetical protein
MFHNNENQLYIKQTLTYAKATLGSMEFKIMPSRKNIFEFFYCSQNMINIIIIYLAQYFQRKKCDAMIRIPPFNPLTQGSISSQILFSSMDKMDEKNVNVKQLFQASCPQGVTSSRRLGDKVATPTKLPKGEKRTWNTQQSC